MRMRRRRVHCSCAHLPACICTCLYRVPALRKRPVMWSLFVLSVSLWWKYTGCAGSCSALPVHYTDVCNAEISSCVGRSTVRVICSVAVDSGRSPRVVFQWFNASTHDLTAGGITITAMQTSEIRLSSEGYWWCTVTTEDLPAQPCASRVPALHFYPCSCNPVGFSGTPRVCPTSNRVCDNIFEPGRCQEASLSLFCLTSTFVDLPLPTKTTAPMQKDTHVVASAHETKTVHTWNAPYQSLPEHDVTTISLPPSTSGTPADSTSTISLVQLLYIVGPVVVIIVISMILLLVAIGCVRHRRKKYGIRRGRRSNSRGPTKCDGRKKEEHIYDTVILYPKRVVSPSRYVTHPPAEYEVPVTNSKEKQANDQTTSVNPVYLELYGNEKPNVVTTE